MAHLKLGPIADEKPVRLTTELPAAVHRDLVAYAEVLSRTTGQSVEPAQLVGPMLARFMGSDRAFLKARRFRPVVLTPELGPRDVRPPGPERN